MSTVVPAPVKYEVISSGVDWLTCFCKKGESGLAAEAWLDQMVHEERAAARHMETATRLGFKGLSGVGWFFGRRKDGNLIQLTGHHAPHGAKDVIALSTNVSRIDFQVTVWTEGEQPNLALMHFKQLESMRHGRGHPFNYCLIDQRPVGTTLTINRRISDVYLRCYDKSAEAKLGEPRTVWRYEIELARLAAKRAGMAASKSECLAALSYDLVNEAYRRKGLEPAIGHIDHHLAGESLIEGRTRDTLEWLNKCIRITIARQIKTHGPQTVIDALGLNSYLRPGGKTDAGLP